MKFCVTFVCVVIVRSCFENHASQSGRAWMSMDKQTIEIAFKPVPMSTLNCEITFTESKIDRIRHKVYTSGKQ